MDTITRIQAVLTDLRDGRISVDTARERNHALKAELGAQEYERARRLALVRIANGR